MGAGHVRGTFADAEDPGAPVWTEGAVAPVGEHRDVVGAVVCRGYIRVPVAVEVRLGDVEWKVRCRGAIPTADGVGACAGEGAVAGVF